MINSCYNKKNSFEFNAPWNTLLEKNYIYIFFLSCLSHSLLRITVVRHLSYNSAFERVAMNGWKLNYIGILMTFVRNVQVHSVLVDVETGLRLLFFFCFFLLLCFCTNWKWRKRWVCKKGKQQNERFNNSKRKKKFRKIAHEICRVHAYDVKAHYELNNWMKKNARIEIETKRIK